MTLTLIFNYVIVNARVCIGGPRARGEIFLLKSVGLCQDGAICDEAANSTIQGGWAGGGDEDGSSAIGSFADLAAG